MAAVSYADWAEFVKAVEQRFGLSQEWCIENLFHLRPGPQESLYAFWLRVEDQRARYNVSKAEVYCKFASNEFVDANMRGRLESIADHAAQQGGGGILNWDDLIAIARRREL